MTEGTERTALERMVRAQKDYDAALREYRTIQAMSEKERESVFAKERFRVAWDRLHVSAGELSTAGEELRRLRSSKIHRIH